MKHPLRVVFFDVIPALAAISYVAIAWSTPWCRSHYSPFCRAVAYLLGSLSFAGGVVAALVLTVALGMTLSMIVRRAFAPAGVKRPGMKLALAGLLAIPATGHFLFITPGLSSGWGPLVAVIATAVVAVAYVPCLVGFHVNRAAFRVEGPGESTLRVGGDGIAILVALHLCFLFAAYVAARSQAMAAMPGLHVEWAAYEFTLITLVAGFPWNWAVLLLLGGRELPSPGSGMTGLLWLGVAMNYALLARVTFRAFRSRSGAAAQVTAPSSAAN